MGRCADGALAVADDRIAWLGPMSDLPENEAAERQSLNGRWITPALIDCTRIWCLAASGRGIRAAPERRDVCGNRRGWRRHRPRPSAQRGRADAASLTAAAGARLDVLRREGVATVEIKSGYGLDLDAELKMLRVARDLDARQPLTVQTTFLGAHAVPAEYERRADDYIRFVAEEVLPQAHSQGLVGRRRCLLRAHRVLVGTDRAAVRSSVRTRTASETARGPA